MRERGCLIATDLMVMQMFVKGLCIPELVKGFDLIRHHLRQNLTDYQTASRYEASRLFSLANFTIGFL